MIAARVYLVSFYLHQTLSNNKLTNLTVNGHYKHIVRSSIAGAFRWRCQGKGSEFGQVIRVMQRVIFLILGQRAHEHPQHQCSTVERVSQTARNNSVSPEAPSAPRPPCANIFPPRSCLSSFLQLSQQTQNRSNHVRSTTPSMATSTTSIPSQCSLCKTTRKRIKMTGQRVGMLGATIMIRTLR